jgi:hypothetical protein
VRTLILSAALVCVAGPVWACATCACGDPTLTATGVEQPYRNRVRLGLEERYSDHRSGSDQLLSHGYTLRSSLAVAWSPIDRLTLGTFLPWMTSWVRHDDRLDTINGLGDLEMSARVVAVRDRKFAPHHLFWVNAGLKFPTAPRLDDDRGYPYPEDDQPGSGSWDPFAGLTYAWFSGDKWSVFGSVSYRYTTDGPRGYRRGSTLGWATAAQLQPWSWGGFSLGVNGSWSQSDQLPNGNAAPNTGGVLLTVAPGFLAAPRTDVILRLVVDVPVAQALYGDQYQGPQVMLTLNYDVR